MTNISKLNQIKSWKQSFLDYSEFLFYEKASLQNITFEKLNINAVFYELLLKKNVEKNR